MSNEYFPDVDRIRYEGPDTGNRLAFRHYNADEVVMGKTMAEHLRFAVAYWHSFASLGSDKFGAPTMKRPYQQAGGPMDVARARLDFAFEFFSKLGAPYFCFHDTDLASEGEDLSESLKRTDTMVELVKKKMDETGVGLLFGSQNLFQNPRFMDGGYTNPSPEIFAWAAAKAKKMIEVCHELNAHGQAFWGGREGYETMLNTDVKREQDQQARFFQMAIEYKKKSALRVSSTSNRSLASRSSGSTTSTWPPSMHFCSDTVLPMISRSISRRIMRRSPTPPSSMKLTTPSLTVSSGRSTPIAATNCSVGIQTSFLPTVTKQRW